MPTSLPPLPDEIHENAADAASRGSAEPDLTSAFSGGLPPALEAVRMIETGYKMLAMSMPSFVPVAAQAISQLRMMMSPQGADAGGPEMGPTGPAITGMTQNPMTLPAPPQGM
jgi:hypothetical protein